MEKGKTWGSIDDYIESQPAAVQKKLTSIRRLVHQVAPEAQEKISYQMPAFALDGNLVYFAAHANHIGFYPGSANVVFTTFKKELARYKSGKGSIQFPLEEALPLELIKRIVKFRVEENARKKKKKK